MKLTTLDYDTPVDHILSDTETFSDLRVKRSIHCQYHEHIGSIVQKGRRMVGMCFRNLQGR